MNPRGEIARERRRQIQVRKAFEAGLALAEQADRDLSAFYLACAEYMVFSMDRLHEQDQYIHDLLKQRIPIEDGDAHERLDVLEERQGKSRELMETFRHGMEKFRQAGRDGIQAFEKGARQFTAKFTSLLAPRKNPFHKHTDELFTEEDWVVIAGVSEDSLGREAELFVAVQRAAPANADPEEMTVEHK
jgi:hypothetical protein